MSASPTYPRTGFLEVRIVREPVADSFGHQFSMVVNGTSTGMRYPTEHSALTHASVIADAYQLLPS